MSINQQTKDDLRGKDVGSQGVTLFVEDLLKSEEA
jgi:hypothetical protein